MSRARNPLTIISFATWATSFALLVGLGRTLPALALSTWVSFPAVFNLIKALTRCDLARSWRASLIVSIPSALSVLLICYVRFMATDAQSPLALLFWPLGFFVLLPIAWAFGRAYYDYIERPLPNSSFKPTPLHGNKFQR